MTTVTQVRPTLTALPERMKKLPVDERGFPVPWFVEWIDNKPEFRVMNRQRWHDAVVKSLCWVCGEKLGLIQVFTVGPMCTVNKTTAEPPSHRDCAIWSAKNCPFLSKPHMVRREDEFTEQLDRVGVAINRNPGTVCLWFTRSFTLFRDQNNQPLIQMGEADHIEWFCQGRRATREEVLESIRTGLPLLGELAEAEGPAAVRDLHVMAENAIRRLVPKE